MKNIVEEIYNKLPSSWEDVTIEDFAKLSSIKITEEDELDNLFVGADNTLKVISILSDIMVENIEELPLISVLKLSNKLSFMDVVPTPNKKCTIKWKNTNELTYNDFILFNQFEKDFMNNLPLLIPALAKTEISEEEANKMNMVDAATAFFFHKKALKKSYRNMKLFSEAMITGMKIKMWFRKILFNRK